MTLAMETKAIEAAVSGLRYRAEAFVEGRFVPAASGALFPTENPATARFRRGCRLRHGRCRSGRAVGAQGVRKRGLVADVALEPQEGAAEVRRRCWKPTPANWPCWIAWRAASRSAIA